jgi:hypothetical protein
MRRFAFPSLLLSSMLAVATPACDGDNGNTNNPRPDTTTGTDTSTGNDTTTGTDTSTGNDTTTNPDVPVGDRDVKSLQAEAEAANPASVCDADQANKAFVNINPAVTVKGVVVTSPRFDAFKNTNDPTKNLHGYYVADASGGAWSGILVTVPASQNTEFAVGDTLDVSGQLLDYYCNTQISADSITKIGTGTPPAPLQVNAADAVSEALEGVVVSLQGVEVIRQKTSSSGTPIQAFEVKGQDETAFELAADFFRPLGVAVGGKYHVTGVMKFAFGARQLHPRNAGEVVFAAEVGTTTIVAIQSAAASTACTGIFAGLPAKLTATIASAKHFATGDLDGYYVTDGTSEPFSGLQVTVAKSANTNFAVGDVVEINGVHRERFCMTQFDATSITKTGDGGTVPAPVVLANDISQADFEKYEGMLVEFNNLTIGERHTHAQSSEYAKPFTTNATPMIDWTLLSGMNVIPPVGTQLSALRGFVRESFETRRVCPRTAEDMVTAN